MKFRYARHCNDLQTLKEFYCEVLGLKVVGSFQNHEQYNGVFLSYENCNWEIEFTQSASLANHKPDDDDILVLYPTTTQHYSEILNKINKQGVEILKSKNPYWNQNGVLIKDSEGFNVVVAKYKA